MGEHDPGPGCYGKLDVLVNNAAITYDTWQRAIDAGLAVVREAAETNLYGPWLMVQAFLPLLRASAHPRIVNVSSEAASLAGMGSGTPASPVVPAALQIQDHYAERVRYLPPEPFVRTPGATESGPANAMRLLSG